MPPLMLFRARTAFQTVIVTGLFYLPLNEIEIHLFAPPTRRKSFYIDFYCSNKTHQFFLVLQTFEGADVRQEVSPTINFCDHFNKMNIIIVREFDKVITILIRSLAYQIDYHIFNYTCLSLLHRVNLYVDFVRNLRKVMIHCGT